MAISALKRWRNGEVFTARDYMYEREEIVAEVNRLAGLLTGDSDLDVNSLEASSLTVGTTTVTDLNQVGINSYLDSDQPTGYTKEGDLWFKTSE
ncbi:MAG: hypothetical protein EBY39_03305 [Flavobacteriia bacterium]|nr:hypothetical protein [Flavobacteriia bacterium]